MVYTTSISVLNFSILDGRVSCLQFLAIINKAPMNIYVHDFWRKYLLIFLG